MSVGADDATIQTASRSSEATASAPPPQARITDHGSEFHRSRAPRVSRIPCTSTSSFTPTDFHRQAGPQLESERLLAGIDT